MNEILVDKPYEFVPPRHGKFWIWLVCTLNIHRWWLKKTDGLENFSCTNGDRLRESAKAGHGIILTPNHCRLSDPMAMAEVVKASGVYTYSMASWHLFHTGKFVAWCMPRLGGFSVNRDGVDRKALDTAIDCVAKTSRPLTIFPEGSITRCNDRLFPFLDGIGFIARSAAKRRAKQSPASKVVVHPLAFRYRFHGDIDETSHEILDDLDSHLNADTSNQSSLLERLHTVCENTLGMKESIAFGSERSGEFFERRDRFVDEVLADCEQRYLGETQNGDVISRIKAMRPHIVPALTRGEYGGEQEERVRQDLNNLFTAQAFSYFPAEYLDPDKSRVSVDRILETIYKLDEIITGENRAVLSNEVTIDVLDAVEVSPERPPRGAPDPLIETITENLQTRLIEMQELSREYKA
jgi:1-acyl-sn-glycerol-3-phosphate acyltransferase